jgi:hypothetical protein
MMLQVWDIPEHWYKGIIKNYIKFGLHVYMPGFILFIAQVPCSCCSFIDVLSVFQLSELVINDITC